MTTERRYALPVGQTDWTVNSRADVHFRWEYDDGRESLLRLYEKGKAQQWDAAQRIDWSQDLDPENPMELPDQAISIYGSEVWNRLNDAEKKNLRRHLQAWQISQFLHGEQGALICTAKIVEQVPSLDAKYYAATQVMDEARHVEAFSRLLHEKFDLAYPISPPLRSLLENVLSDSRWDFLYLGMQVLVEGLALAAFQRIRDMAKNSLASAVNAYVMQDEARHVAFGRIALRDYYPKLTEAERAEREEFAVEACYLMRDRFVAEELWDAVGLPKDECVAFVEQSPFMKQYRARLFSRIVPTLRDAGLWGPKVRGAFEDMGVLEFANVDAAELFEQDNRVAAELDARRVTPSPRSVPLAPRPA